ncbi:MAG TPA: ester cyclase [Blastocatellia bacterium]|nr:ester cyclase [Blastocatellia bacterium]
MNPAMSPVDAKALVRKATEEVWNKGNLAAIDELYATNYVRHDPATPDVRPGPEGVKQLVTTFRNAFPDLHITIEDMIFEGDKVVTRYSTSGTHKGEFMGIAPTGKYGTSSGIAIGHIVNGWIGEEWVHWDTLGTLKQFGVFPA